MDWRGERQEGEPWVGGSCKGRSREVRLRLRLQQVWWEGGSLREKLGASAGEESDAAPHLLSAVHRAQDFYIWYGG